MNAQRRKKLDQIKSDLQVVIEDEQAAYDNLPDSIREGEKGDQMQDGIDSMQTALDELEGMEQNLKLCRERPLTGYTIAAEMLRRSETKP